MDNDKKPPPQRKPGEDDTLFDIDFLDDATSPSGSHSKTTRSHANTNYVPAVHVFPEETIDLDADDDNIENDMHENPFMSNNDDDQMSWNANRFDSSAYQPQSLRAGKPPGLFTRFGNGIKNAFTFKQKKGPESFEMNHYNAVTNNELDDSYSSSRNKFNIKILFNRYVLRKNVGDTDGNGEPRVIHINDPLINSSFGYSDNHISTTKYNFATFLPKFLFQEFSKYANLFFLCTSAIQQVPHVSPTNRYTTIGTLLVVLIVSAMKECIEDIKRANSDKELNNSTAEIFSEAHDDFVEKRWIDIRVGDIIRVKSEEPIPADTIIPVSYTHLDVYKRQVLPVAIESKSLTTDSIVGAIDNLILLVSLIKVPVGNPLCKP